MGALGALLLCGLVFWGLVVVFFGLVALALGLVGSLLLLGALLIVSERGAPPAEPRVHQVEDVGPLRRELPETRRAA